MKNRNVETTGRDAIDEYTVDGRVVNVGTTEWMQLRNGGILT